MKIDQILEKAFTTQDLASGGLLNPDQAARFIQGVFDKSVVSVEARREPMRANTRIIDKITCAGDVLQLPVAVGSEHTNTTKPTTTKVTLSAKEVIACIDIAYESLEDNIEGKGLFDTILEMTANKVAFELDQLVLHGDASGATGTFLDAFDGIFHQLSTNTYDANGVVMSKTVLAAALKKLPGKYIQNESDFRFYVSHIARLDYIDSLAAIAVNDAFTKYLIEAKEPAFGGIAVRKVGAIKTESVTGTVPGSKALLINPKNIVVGIHRDIMFEFERMPRKRVVEVTMTMKLDAKLEEETAAVKIENIKHSVAI